MMQDEEKRTMWVITSSFPENVEMMLLMWPHSDISTSYRPVGKGLCLDGITLSGFPVVKRFINKLAYSGFISHFFNRYVD